MNNFTLPANLSDWTQEPVIGFAFSKEGEDDHTLFIGPVQIDPAVALAAPKMLAALESAQTAMYLAGYDNDVTEQIDDAIALARGEGV